LASVSLQTGRIQFRHPIVRDDDGHGFIVKKRLGRLPGLEQDQVRIDLEKLIAKKPRLRSDVAETDDIGDIAKDIYFEPMAQMTEDTETLLRFAKLTTTQKAKGEQIIRFLRANRFIENGALEADNNAGENALRPIALGRKNYLFVGSEHGGRRAAILYSLIRTCERHQVNAWGYLRDVLVRISAHPECISQTAGGIHPEVAALDVPAPGHHDSKRCTCPQWSSTRRAYPCIRKPLKRNERTTLSYEVFHEIS